MNAISYIILGIIIVAVAFAIKGTKKNKCSGCTHDCHNCKKITKK